MKMFLAASLLAASCTTIDMHYRVEGWPELTITEYRVPQAEMLARCKKYVGAFMTPLACAEFNLITRRCDIWLDVNYAPRWVVEHERLHCRGYDHHGETGMRDFLHRFNNRPTT